MTAKKSRISEITIEKMSRKCQEEATNAAPSGGRSEEPEYYREVARGLRQGTE